MLLLTKNTAYYSLKNEVVCWANSRKFIAVFNQQHCFKFIPWSFKCPFGHKNSDNAVISIENCATNMEWERIQQTHQTSSTYVPHTNFLFEFEGQNNNDTYSSVPVCSSGSTTASCTFQARYIAPNAQHIGLKPGTFAVNVPSMQMLGTLIGKSMYRPLSSAEPAWRNGDGTRLAEVERQCLKAEGRCFICEDS
ncbi:hypothetical protein B0H10DRAFT_1953173 [Mycena sp. CBHHK59/15]|nr:hypothetical protein B0H10DRAFT_1953173 [Mycena sp. CBHHK59/15]